MGHTGWLGPNLLFTCTWWVFKSRVLSTKYLHLLCVCRGILWWDCVSRSLVCDIFLRNRLPILGTEIYGHETYLVSNANAPQPLIQSWFVGKNLLHLTSSRNLQTFFCLFYSHQFVNILRIVPVPHFPICRIVVICREWSFDCNNLSTRMFRQ